MTDFRLQDKQTEKGLRKITWASVFRFPFDSEYGNFRLFVENGKQKRQTSICFLQTENGSLFFLVGKR
jgi:hypothetical protein